MSSTKTILIGKNKKKLTKSFLDDFIPRFNENDIPEEDLCIDNSFELKQYKSKKNNNNNKPTQTKQDSTISNDNNDNNPTQTKQDNTNEIDQIKLKQKLENKLEKNLENNKQLTPYIKNKLDVSVPIHIPNNIPNIHNNIIGNKNHKQNLTNIVQQYNDKHKKKKEYDTISTNSSILDIMSMVDMDTTKLDFIETNITKKIERKHIPSYSKKLLISNKANNGVIYKKTKAKDRKQYKNYNVFYNKYYPSIKTKENVIVNNNNHKLMCTKKNINKNTLHHIREVLYKHKIIHDENINMPDDMLYDLYAMLSDKSYKFNIKNKYEY